MENWSLKLAQRHSQPSKFCSPKACETWSKLVLCRKSWHARCATSKSWYPLVARYCWTFPKNRENEQQNHLKMVWLPEGILLTQIFEEWVRWPWPATKSMDSQGIKAPTGLESSTSKKTHLVGSKVSKTGPTMDPKSIQYLRIVAEVLHWVSRPSGLWLSSKQPATSGSIAGTGTASLRLSVWFYIGVYI